MEIINIKNLENLLQSNWTSFLNQTQIMRLVLQHVRDTDFQSSQDNQFTHPKRTQITITNFKIKENVSFEVWIEYTVPKQNGIVVGTLILDFDVKNEPIISESYGTHFLNCIP